VVNQTPGASKKSPAKKIIAALLVVAVAVAAFLFFFRSDEQLIRARFDTLATAYNEGNVNKLVSCFDHRTQSELKAVIRLTSSVLGVDISDLYTVLVGLSPEIAALTGEDATVTITVHAIRISGRTASVDTTFSVGGESDDVTFSMVKEGLQWYINLSG